jgi:hypothetical protein
MKYYTHFAKYIPDLKENLEQQMVSCIFHEETTNSLSVNLEKGLYNCFGCQKSGDIFSLVMEKENCSFKQARNKIVGDSQATILSIAEVNEAHNYLVSKEHLINQCGTHRLWTLPTIIKFKIGYNNGRFYIPIFDEKGQLKNIRKYLMVGEATKKNPKFLGVPGHNSSYFFPISNLITKDEFLSKFILICAGEPDTILACQFGFNAGTFTSGEGSFNRNLLPYFKNKIVYMCYDRDHTGQLSLRNVGYELAKYAKEVRNVRLPFGDGENR